MKRSLFILPEIILCICILFSVPIILNGQTNLGKIEEVDQDTLTTGLNMDAVYQRPLLSFDKAPVAIGGYLEVNSIYSIEDGISEGLSFQARRLTLFVSATVSRHLKFLTEVELEEGGREINIEFAALDITFDPLLNLRGGIVMNPIGAFNQNHDGPKWEFVERPDMAVNLLPATFSNAGFGIFGTTYRGNWVLGYEAYLTNGFDDSIIDNEQNRTFLPAVKENSERFEESNSGRPLWTGKVAIKHRKIGELGLSYMGGTYNAFNRDGLTLSEKRGVDVFALDLSGTIQKTGTSITGEVAYVSVDLPPDFNQQYGDRQMGFYLDIVQPIFKGKVWEWENATFNAAARVDYVDWNIGSFRETGGDIGDDLFAVMPALSFRPSAQTVIRLNYRYQWQRDLLQNPASRQATWYFGLSSYF